MLYERTLVYKRAGQVVTYQKTTVLQGLGSVNIHSDPFSFTLPACVCFFFECIEMGANNSASASRKRSSNKNLVTADVGNNIQTPVFDQREVKVTKKMFLKDHPIGFITRDEFVDAYGAFFPYSDPSSIAGHIFRSLDTKGCGTLDFNQYLHALAVTQRGTETQRMRFVFNVFDVNADGLISRQEYDEIQDALDMLAPPSRPKQKHSVPGNGPTPGLFSTTKPSVSQQPSYMCYGSNKSASCTNLSQLAPPQSVTSSPRNSQLSTSTNMMGNGRCLNVTNLTQSSSPLSQLSNAPVYPTARRITVAGGPQRTPRFSYAGLQTEGQRSRPRLTATPPPRIGKLQERDSIDESEDDSSLVSTTLSTSLQYRMSVANSFDSQMLAETNLLDSGTPTSYDSSSMDATSLLQDRTTPRFCICSSPTSDFSNESGDDLFTLMDVDGDGFLCFEEFAVAVRRDPALLYLLNVGQ